MQTNILSTSNTPINRGPNSKRLVLKKKGEGAGEILWLKRKNIRLKCIDEKKIGLCSYM